MDLWASESDAKFTRGSASFHRLTCEVGVVVHMHRKSFSLINVNSLLDGVIIAEWIFSRGDGSGWLYLYSWKEWRILWELVFSLTRHCFPHPSSSYSRYTASANQLWTRIALVCSFHLRYYEKTRIRGMQNYFCSFKPQVVLLIRGWTLVRGSGYKKSCVSLEKVQIAFLPFILQLLSCALFLATARVVFFKIMGNSTHFRFVMRTLRLPISSGMESWFMWHSTLK